MGDVEHTTAAKTTVVMAMEAGAETTSVQRCGRRTRTPMSFVAIFFAGIIAAVTTLHFVFMTATTSTTTAVPAAAHRSRQGTDLSLKKIGTPQVFPGDIYRAAEDDRAGGSSLSEGIDGASIQGRGDGDGEDPGNLKLAWLMSFPNSGTSFTVKVVRKTTRTSTASNYGQHNLDGNGSSVPLFGYDGSGSSSSQLQAQPSMATADGTIGGGDDRSPLPPPLPPPRRGPFWSDPQDYNVTKPSDGGYILTKTHCSGRCVECGPKEYVITPPAFLRSCFVGRYNHVDARTGALRLTKKKILYPREDVRKAVHLVRDPFDNVVSRYNLHHRHRNPGPDAPPATKEGFLEFCDGLGRRYYDEERRSRLFDNETLDILKDVPCRAEFLRYLLWHNLAFISTLDLEIPVLVLHYKDYQTNFNSTVLTLLEFLERPGVDDPPKFIEGKEYRAYFTEEHIEAVRNVAFKVALSRTWVHIKRYFD